MQWRTSKRILALDHPLVMGILNVTPDSFSDGGKYDSVGAALKRTEEMIGEGADIIDVGGESTRPGSERVSPEDEIGRVAPVIAAIANRFDVPVSIDTSKSTVAKAAVDAGAEIINDISALRWDAAIAEVAAIYKTGLVLMHSRGDFETMHQQPPVEDILSNVAADFHRAIAIAEATGVDSDQIVLDIGICFGKTVEQNLELIAKLDKLIGEFENFPVMVGTSRKSFLARILGDVPVDERLNGSLATAAIAVWNGAKIIRAHDVRETVEAVRVAYAVSSWCSV